MSHIAVLNLGTGNLHSVVKALQFVAPHLSCTITHDPQQILAAERVVLPGQGAIGTWMEQVQQRDLRGVIEQVIARKPVLGICVGMQALFTHSEEDGGTASLGLIAGEMRRFAAVAADSAVDSAVDSSGDTMGATPRGLSIPQMGWNEVWQQAAHPLWQGIADGARFYFANSYYGQCAVSAQQAGSCHYGVEFAAAVMHNNVFAVQFHPEKSQQDGLQLLRNFVHWQP